LKPRDYLSARSAPSGLSFSGGNDASWKRRRLVSRSVASLLGRRSALRLSSERCHSGKGVRVSAMFRRAGEALDMSLYCIYLRYRYCY